MAKFLYVWSEEDRDKLLQRGYRLLTQYENEPYFIFADRDYPTQEDYNELYGNDIEFVPSETLTF